MEILKNQKNKRMKKIAVVVFACLNALSVFGQIPPVDVAELTLKISALGTEEFFYGFAEGDQIVLNFEELKGKELKEVEIIELPGSSKFMDYKTVKIVDKKISVNKIAKTVCVLCFIKKKITASIIENNI